MKKSIWSKVLLESGMIILSVLIALFINEWKTAHNERSRTEMIMDNLQKEIVINQIYLKELVEYHEGVRAKLENVYRQDSVQPIFFPNNIFEIHLVAPKGIIQGQLNDIAWTVAKQNQITNRIPLQESQLLFAIYRQQEIVNETIGRIIDFLNTREIQRRAIVKESAIVFGLKINELTEQEKNLSKKYSDFLDGQGDE